MLHKFILAESAETYNLEGGEITKFLLTGLETEGRISLYDSILPKGNFAPLHYHEIDMEIFYIISGQVEFIVNNEKIIANPGDTVMAGVLVKRAFKALADSRMLVINTPGGPSEGFLREIASLPPGSGPSAEQKRRFKEVYKVHLVE